MKIAIVGSGIAGNVLAHHLHTEHDITVFEAGGHVGGHAHTHTVEHEGRTLQVDTGFLVFNDRTYPNFIALLRELGVESQPSEMSFSVRCAATGLEYNGTSLNGLFAQRTNLLRPSFWGMIRDILRFNRDAPALLQDPSESRSMGDYLDAGRYSPAFVRQYIVPMGAAIWSCGAQALLDFPAAFFVRFLHNHGMLSIDDRPQWRTIRGGSARYVERLTAPFRSRIHLRTAVEYVRRAPNGVLVKVAGAEAQRFDRVFLACHADDALSILADASAPERDTLGAIQYSRNEVALHTDTALLPRRKLAWAAWNYHLLEERAGTRAAVTYNLELLQRLGTQSPLLVTLNMTGHIAPDRMLQKLEYRHPVYTHAAIAAQARQAEINGARHVYFAGAYWRNGFHEDGVVSALDALEHFRQREHEQRALLRSA